MFIEASTPRIADDRTRLVSPKLTAEKHCVKFWYHMYGGKMGSLSVSHTDISRSCE